MPRDDYELLDIVPGRKLERFGDAVIVRPAPAAKKVAAKSRSQWPALTAEFVREGRQGEWIFHRPLPDPWIVRSAGREHYLEATPSGQVGLFPEQAPLRERLEARLKALVETRPSARVLDLFSYTGGNAMAAAAAGAEVVSVDSAKSVLGWARRNAERNGLGEAPIRRIPEDAMRFVEREARRGQRYDAVLIDPPTFGRGPGGRTWKIERDLEPLLGAVSSLLTDGPAFVLLTAHTTAWTPAGLAQKLTASLGDRPGMSESGVLRTVAASGERLFTGIWAQRETHA